MLVATSTCVKYDRPLCYQFVHVVEDDRWLKKKKRSEKKKMKEKRREYKRIIKPNSTFHII